MAVKIEEKASPVLPSPFFLVFHFLVSLSNLVTVGKRGYLLKLIKIKSNKQLHFLVLLHELSHHLCLVASRLDSADKERSHRPGESSWVVLFG